MVNKIISNIESSIEIKKKILDNVEILNNIELLVNQFCSAVQWIKTQEEFVKYNIDEFIEIGPSRVLSNMIKSVYNGKITFIKVANWSSIGFKQASLLMRNLL
jgi:malonyl CoA-acyl carrier protein transacylase